MFKLLARHLHAVAVAFWAITVVYIVFVLSVYKSAAQVISALYVISALLLIQSFGGFAAIVIQCKRDQ